MTTTQIIVILAFLFSSCSQTGKSTPTDKKNSIRVDIPSPDSVTNAIGGHLNFTDDVTEIDSTEQRAFWNNVVIPILDKDRETVLSNMNFPVSGDWTFMMQLKKEPDVATKEDFAKVYDRFFNSDFIKSISAQTYSNIPGYKNKDTTWFTISLGRSYGEYEGGLMLEYIKINGKYKLTTVHGAGANFYDMD